MSRGKLKKYKVIFIGTSEFAVPILKAILDSKFLILNSVITQPDKRVGRKQKLEASPVKKLALKYNFSTRRGACPAPNLFWCGTPRSKSKYLLQPEKIIEAKTEIQNLKPDLIIVVAYRQIIPKEILDIPKKGCLNIHPSLLPKYRGPSPVQTEILNGEKTTGVTIILMDEKVDHGPILAERELEILNPKSEIFTRLNFQRKLWRAGKLQITNYKITYRELLEKLADLGAQLLIKTIPKWMEGEIKPKPQDESRATYTKILKKEDGRINWQKSASEIERKIRAFEQWPGTFTKFKVLDKVGKSSSDFIESPRQSREKFKVLKILKAEVISQNKRPKQPWGQVFLTKDKQLAVQTGKGLLILEEVQLEGKSPMKAKDFLNGYPQILGTVCE